ncbi:MAG: flagellar biosynthesis anti-sigma factor FlgM [Phycisphaerales bacterium]
MADASSISGSSEPLARAQAIGRRLGTEHRAAGTPDENPRPRPADSVSLSPEARAAAQTDETTNPIRADLVARVRGELEARTYFTEGKLDAAVDRLIDDIVGG